MRKLILATATLGILTAAGVATATAQYREPIYGGPVYRGPVYEGRNVYMAEPRGGVVYGNRYMRTAPLGPSYGYEPSYADPWYMPGDQAIINQERANERSSR